MQIVLTFFVKTPDLIKDLGSSKEDFNLRHLDTKHKLFDLRLKKISNNLRKNKLNFLALGSIPPKGVWGNFRNQKWREIKKIEPINSYLIFFIINQKTTSTNCSIKLKDSKSKI